MSSKNAFELEICDRLVFLQVLALIARADGVQPVERAAIMHWVDAWKFDDHGRAAVEDVLECGADMGDLVRRLSSTRSRLLLVQELIVLGYLDGDYSDNERAVVREIAAIAGVGRPRLTAMEQWAEDGIQWRQRGACLVDPSYTGDAR